MRISHVCVHLRRLPCFMRDEADALAPAHRGGFKPYPGKELPLLIDAMRLLYHKTEENANILSGTFLYLQNFL